MNSPAALIDGQDTRFRVAQSPLRLLLLDFDGVFTDNHVYVFQDGREAVRCSRLDGIGLRRLERAGVVAFILSTETNPVVEARAAKLQIGCRSGLSDKVAAARATAAEYGVTLSEAGFVGNDVNDIDLLREVALPIAVADAHEDIWAFARFRTRRPGGAGAVREICDAVATARAVDAR